MRRRSRLERLNKREEKASIKKIAYFLVISLLLLIFIFTLGIPLLSRLANFLGVIFKNQTQEVTDVDKSIPQAPILDPLPSATNSARLVLSGFSATPGKVLIFDNDEKIGETKSEGGKFRFDELTLEVGDNNIAVKALTESAEESDFSEVRRVIFLEQEPKLEVENPGENQSFSGNNRIKVSGKTDKDVQVYANGFLANTNFDGLFEVFIPLVSGENNLEIRAIDPAGNTKTVRRKVNYNK